MKARKSIISCSKRRVAIVLPEIVEEQMMNLLTTTIYCLGTKIKDIRERTGDWMLAAGYEVEASASFRVDQSSTLAKIPYHILA